jgi:hypothetical protein
LATSNDVACKKNDNSKKKKKKKETRKETTKKLHWTACYQSLDSTALADKVLVNLLLSTGAAQYKTTGENETNKKCATRTAGDEVNEAKNALDGRVGGLVVAKPKSVVVGRALRLGGRRLLALDHCAVRELGGAVVSAVRAPSRQLLVELGRKRVQDLRARVAVRVVKLAQLRLLQLDVRLGRFRLRALFRGFFLNETFGC